MVRGEFFYDIFWAFLETHKISHADVIAYVLSHLPPFIAAIGVVTILFFVVRHDLAQQDDPSQRTQPSTLIPAQPSQSPITTQTQGKLHCSFSMKDAGCVRRDTIYTEFFTAPGQPPQLLKQTKCDWYRVRVAALNHNVTNCRGQILSVTRAGNNVLAGENPSVTFAPGNQADAMAKTIHVGVPEYLDFLTVFEDNRAELAVPLGLQSSSINWRDIFAQAGDYTIEVAVTTPDATTASIELLFKWTLDRRNVQITNQKETTAANNQPATLRLEVGESGPFFSTKGSGLYDIKRTFSIKLSNVHPHKTARNCRVVVTQIEPQEEYVGPWLLKEIPSLAAGDHAFIPLARYGEARDPKKYDCADTFFTTFLGKYGSPSLGVNKVYLFTLRGTAIDNPMCEFRCKLWVGDDGRFHIEEAALQ